MREASRNGLILAAAALTGVLSLPPGAAAGDVSGYIDFSTLTFRTAPLRPTSDQPLVLYTSDFERPPVPTYDGCVSGEYWYDEAEVEGDVISIQIVGEECPSGSASPWAPPPLTRVTRAWRLGVLPAGLYKVKVAGVEWTRLRVHDPSPVLELRDGRFLVSVESGFPDAVSRPVPLTAESGFFSFFDGSNVELTVKILDGRGLNGHFWLFAASMTDLPFALTVVDTAGPCSPDCPKRTYSAVAGRNANVIDTELFP